MVDTKLEDYFEEARPFVKDFCIQHIHEFDNRMPTHPGIQHLDNGKRIHTLQVIKMALELNQGLDRQEIIETCLVHDLKGCEALNLKDNQKEAIAATKGRSTYSDWRPKPYHRFVVLILIADMWSAFINIENR